MTGKIMLPKGKPMLFYSLPVLTILIIGFLLWAKPGITGLAIAEPLAPEKIKVTIHTADNEVLPELAQVTVRIGNDAKIITAEEFVQLSGVNPVRVQLLGEADAYGFTGANQYSITLEQLGFADKYLFSRTDLEASVTFGGSVLRTAKITIGPD